MVPAAADLGDRLARFAERPAAMVVLAGWAAAEAILFPIVPDVGLCLLLLLAPRAFDRLFLAVLAGALVGTIGLAALTAVAPDELGSAIHALPGVDASQFAQARAGVEGEGPLGFKQFGAGPPLKVYSSEWLAIGGDGPGLLLGAVLNRITRIGPLAIGAALLGRVAGGWIRRHARRIVVAYLAVWVVVYAILWS
jgi:1-acyl-sn-glycerol-3-phosphate acyltransferase